MSNISERVTKIIAEQLSVEPVQVVADASLLGDLGADSLDQVELLMALEEEFSIDIPDDIHTNMVKVQDVIDYVHANAVTES